MQLKCMVGSFQGLHKLLGWHLEASTKLEAVIWAIVSRHTVDLVGENPGC